ncbi:hypothetical protein M885DRAFT_581383, partial [Pelagophyceae sp. CCMP2097]
MYKQLQSDVAVLAEASEDSARFLGGIVRLCAHDFMDYMAHPPNVDPKDPNSPLEPQGGSQGCIQFLEPDNVGLSDIWTVETVDALGNVVVPGTELWRLYDLNYKPFGVTIADFWVA